MEAFRFKRWCDYALQSDWGVQIEFEGSIIYIIYTIHVYTHARSWRFIHCITRFAGLDDWVFALAPIFSNVSVYLLLSLTPSLSLSLSGVCKFTCKWVSSFRVLYPNPKLMPRNNNNNRYTRQRRFFIIGLSTYLPSLSSPFPISRLHFWGVVSNILYCIFTFF